MLFGGENESVFFDEPVSEYASFFWGTPEEPFAEEMPESELATLDSPIQENPLISTQVEKLKAAREESKVWVQSLIGSVPEILGLIASCGPACLAHGHGLLSALGGSAGTSGGSGLFGALSHIHTDGSSHQEGHEHKPVTLPSTSSLPSARKSSSSGYYSPFFWLPSLWLSEEMQFTPIDELWHGSRSHVGTDDLLGGLLRAA